MTVGISRSDETLLQVPLVPEVLAAGAPRDRLSYRTLRTLADLDPAVAEVTGLHPLPHRGRAGPADDDATIAVVDRGGVRPGFPSRTERDPRAAGHQAPGRDRARAVSWPEAAATGAPSSSCPR